MQTYTNVHMYVYTCVCACRKCLACVCGRKLYFMVAIVKFSFTVTVHNFWRKSLASPPALQVVSRTFCTSTFKYMHTYIYIHMFLLVSCETRLEVTHTPWRIVPSVLKFAGLCLLAHTPIHEYIFVYFYTCLR